MAIINGKKVAATGISLLQFLIEQKYETRSIVVEKNYEIIPKADWDKNMIQDDDIIEILHFVGGG